MGFTLKQYADSVLSNVGAVFSDASIALPAHQYVTPGTFESVSFDCEQVTVTLSPVTRGDPGEQRGDRVLLGAFSVRVSVAVLRCVPTSATTAPVPASDQSAAAAIILADLDVLWRRTKDILEADGCKYAGLIEAGLLDISGGIGGSKLLAVVDLIDA